MWTDREYIICAAVHCDDGKKYAWQPVETGFVVLGLRHEDCERMLKEIIRVPRIVLLKRSQRGYFTSRGRFVNFHEAARVSSAAGQTVMRSFLIPEDLY